MKEILTAAIDIGTTTISAVVLDVLSERQLETFNIPNDGEIKSDLAFERIQDPKKIVKRAELLVKKLQQSYPNILSFGFTGQMHGILYLNGEGEAVSPLYTWQDGRGEQLSKGVSYCEELSRLSGYPMATGYGLTTHYYNMKNSLVPEDAVTLCSIMDYIAMHFASLKSPKLHPSVAASFGMFDIENNCFDKEALKRCGITIALPEIVGDEVIGSMGKTQITPAIGDNQASIFGSLAEEDSSVLVNYGTGSQISMVTSQTKATPPLEIRPYIGKKNIVCGSALCGGYAYEILEGFFREYAEALGVEGRQYQTMDRLCREAYRQGVKPLEVTPLFKGTRKDPTLRGSINGISSANLTPKSLILGMVEGMAEELYRMYLLADIKDRTTLVASGNGVQKNDILQKLLAEKFGMELKLPENKEEAATGAAMYSLYCLAPNEDILSDVKGCIAYK